ncbi:MND1-interacting protein 1-like [Rhodamnia argentea]|uniref:MND1-interacting protein 1-like n=1 Tax=Rhodamnia argentea TaxID=178133 RepID=A0A8B8NS15_9MYRT|nr:MND1-interacting protein 1-like [Rhodamnia argentea]
MTGTAREKHIRANRRSHSRSSKPDMDHSAHSNQSPIPNSTPESSLNPSASPQVPIPSPAPYQAPSLEQNPIPSPNANPDCNPILDDSNAWGYCTEEQLEELLRKHVQFYYNEALAKLCALGYDEDVALRAVLRNGHCYGGMDMLTNILHNTLAYLNSGGDGASSGESELGFSDLKQLEECSLAGMVCLLQQVRPNLSRGDAMWCLLTSDLHVGRASTIEIPVVQSPSDGLGPVGDKSNAESGANDAAACVSAPVLGRFLCSLGFSNGGNDYVEAVNGLGDIGGMTMQKDIECPKRFNLSPSMKSLLKRNVAMFAAGFRANAKTLKGQPPFSQNGPPSGGASVVLREKATVEKNAESRNSKNQDDLHAMMRKFLDMDIGASIDENPEVAEEERKDEIILSMLHQIKDLEKQVKERKEWAQQKAMQAARKLSSDMTELKLLRMEMDETQRLKKGKQTLEETTMKRQSDMEKALRKASGQVDQANAAVRRLETENAEIRAEMEASKLSASESVSSCLEVAKREKRSLKKLLAWEKQKTKMQEDIAEERQKISDLQQQLVQINQASEEAEVKWKQAKKEKELAQAQVEEERRLKEAAEASSKRKLESLRLKIEIDFQRKKDDIKRLEQELSRLKMSASAQSADVHHGSHASPVAKSVGGKPEGEAIARLLHQLELEDSPEVNRDRQCVLCMKDEVSVVFLPCTHQVICANCSDSYWGKGKTSCPCCRVPIEQKIRVFGASS